MNWPETLKLDPGAMTALEKAMKDQPMLATWPEDVKYMAADQAKAIADVLIPEFHSELTNAKIAFLFKAHVGGRGYTQWGKAKRASSQLKFLSDVDFVIEFNFETWKPADLIARVTMVDHELTHCGVDDNENFCIVHHDVEEFNSIIQRWGLWDQNIRTLAEVIRPQLELPIGVGAE